MSDWLIELAILLTVRDPPPTLLPPGVELVRGETTEAKLVGFSVRALMVWRADD